MRVVKGAALAAALSLVLAAGTCQDRSTLIAKVQDASRQICGFVPLASTVAAILDRVASTGGAATMVATAANGICQAVTAREPHALYGNADARPTFLDVPIEGKFVK